jgi:hypothetical protein
MYHLSIGIHHDIRQIIVLARLRHKHAIKFIPLGHGVQLLPLDKHMAQN